MKSETLIKVLKGFDNDIKMLQKIKKEGGKICGVKITLSNGAIIEMPKEYLELFSSEILYFQIYNHIWSQTEIIKKELESLKNKIGKK